MTANENWNNCLDINGQGLARCIYNCKDDTECEADCVEQFKTKTENCPCEVGPRQECDTQVLIGHQCDKNYPAENINLYFRQIVKQAALVNFMNAKM